MDAELILRAAAFAAEAHARQKRKVGNIPYVNHVIRVAHHAAESGLSPESIAAALLHDVVEDTRYTLDDVKKKFPERVVRLVHLLTQWWPDDAPPDVKEREKPKYFAAILQDPEAIDLKLLDRADNLNDMVRIARTAHRWAEKYCRSSESELRPLYEACTNEKIRIRYERALTALKRAL